MKYFEVNEPYYALLKANDKEEAIRKYTKHVADDEEGTLNDEIKEVDRDYALIKLSQAPSEDKKLLPISEIIEEFNCQSSEVIVIDGTLI